MKVIKLTDNRGCRSQTIRELRQTLRRIDQKEVVGICMVAITRSGGVRTYFDAECHLRALGAIDLLRDKIRTDGFQE